MTSYKATTARALLAIVGAGVAMAAPAPATGPQRYQTSKALVWVEGTSTLHDWRVESITIEGGVMVADGFFDDAGTPAPAPEGSVSIPVRSLKSGKSRMDSLMYESLSADEYSTIDFRLTGATMGESGASSIATMEVSGRLTIAGTTREISFPLQVDRSVPGVMVVSGELPLEMTQFGIEPPRAMLGTLKTGDEITVGFRWEVTAPGS